MSGYFVTLENPAYRLATLKEADLPAAPPPPPRQPTFVSLPQYQQGQDAKHPLWNRSQQNVCGELFNAFSSVRVVGMVLDLAWRLALQQNGLPLAWHQELWASSLSAEQAAVDALQAVLWSFSEMIAIQGASQPASVIGCAVRRLAQHLTDFLQQYTLVQRDLYGAYGAEDQVAICTAPERVGTSMNPDLDLEVRHGPGFYSTQAYDGTDAAVTSAPSACSFQGYLRNVGDYH